MPQEWSFKDLVAKLAELNEQWVNSLNETWEPERVTFVGSSDQTASIEAQATDNHCYCGLLKGAPQTATGLAGQCLIYSSDGKMHGVLNVIDKGSTGELPVVICVGINYGQIPGSIAAPLTDDTKMRNKLVEAVKLLTETPLGCDVVLPQQFHLVATNFFPWLSLQEWSAMELNSIQESLLLHCFGDRDPIARVAKLISTLGAHSVIFHGATSCVANLAVPTIRTATAGSWSGNVVLSDNLSPHRRNCSNIVTIC